MSEFIVDLSGIASQLHDELRAELLAELRGNENVATWPEWMDTRRAANYLGISVERIRKLKDRGEIPYYQEGRGCKVMFSRRDLSQWMDTFRVEARGGA